MNLKLISSRAFQRYPLLGACLAQVLSLMIIKFFIQFFHFNLSIILFALFQSTLTTIITQYFFKLPKWFFYISTLFPLVFILCFSYLHISNGVYGFLFVLFAMTFSHTLKERVPLYLTNKRTHNALKKILEENSANNFLDLGSGFGGVVRSIAQTKVVAVGVETAPLLWGVSALLSRFTSKGKILRQNIWNTKLDEYDVVYAFLSPAIMEKLYLKVKFEMKTGSLFISNSFAVLDIPHDEVWELSDERKTILYLYRMKN